MTSSEPGTGFGTGRVTRLARAVLLVGERDECEMYAEFLQQSGVPTFASADHDEGFRMAVALSPAAVVADAGRPSIPAGLSWPRV